MHFGNPQSARQAIGGEKQKKNQMKDDDFSEIRVFKSLREAICHHPGMYLGCNLDSEAFYKVIFRVIENAVSPEGANQATQVRLTVQPNSGFSIADNGRGMPIDTYYGWIFQAFGGALQADRFDQLMQEFDQGKRIPPEIQNNPSVKIQPIIEVTLSQIFTGPATPERFSYFGYLWYDGVILNTLSHEFKVTTCAEGKQYLIAFTDGKLTQPLHLVSPSCETGTRIDFQPELSLFAGLSFDIARTNDEMRRLSAKYGDKKFTVVDETTKMEWSFN